MQCQAGQYTTSLKFVLGQVADAADAALAIPMPLFFDISTGATHGVSCCLQHGA
jgi:hypothetical protein